MPKIRVVVVEDSLTVRKRLVEVLGSNPDFEVVGEAADGKAGIEMCEDLRPDVITLDMMLPVMTGIAATEYIMAHFPTPILIVSASVNRGELFRTYDALAAGAVDVLDKPLGEEGDEWERRFVSAVRMVSRIKVITHPRARLATLHQSTTAAPPSRPRSAIVIGASTGGPGALIAVLSRIPAPCPLPIVLVLHLGDPFGIALADWLDAQTAHRVAFAKDGEKLASLAGRVAMAPPDRHVVLRGDALHITTDPMRHSCRPSVDVLFESFARELGSGTVGCLLTGMGRDGAQGLLEIRRQGGHTIAQDEASSIVYGMPREAALLGAAERILPLPEIGPALGALAKGAR